MKYLIASDIHGSAYYCRKLLEAFEREAADRLILLGDLLYHGPRNDLPEEYDTKTVFRLLNEVKDRILAVRGNCDSEVDQMVLQFPMMAEYAVLSEGDKLIYLTHGHVFNMQTPLAFQPGDILLHGHTHVAAWTEFGNQNLYLNPGSISLPKEDTPHGYMILEDRKFTWKTVDGEGYHILDF